jgi:hypothetical protein
MDFREAIGLEKQEHIIENNIILKIIRGQEVLEVWETFDATRRRFNLPFSYYEAVVNLKKEKQDDLLSRCEAENWTEEELRKKISETVST